MGPHQVSDRMDYLPIDRPFLGSVFAFLLSIWPAGVQWSPTVAWLGRKWREEVEKWIEERFTLFGLVRGSFFFVFVHSRNVTILHATTLRCANSNRATIRVWLDTCRGHKKVRCSYMNILRNKSTCPRAVNVVYFHYKSPQRILILFP